MPSRSGKPEPGRELPEAIEVGRVLKAHGIRGEVKVEVESDVPGRFRSGATLLLAPAGREPRPIEIASCRHHAGLALVRFEGIEDRDRAEELRGARLLVAIEDVPAPPAGAFYHFQLIGCRCTDEAAGDLGTVTAVVEDGGGLLLMLDREGRSLPVPFVEAFLREVDVEAGHIRLRLPEGLIEACESRS